MLQNYLRPWICAALWAGLTLPRFFAQPREAPGLALAVPAVTQTSSHPAASHPRPRRVPALDRRIDKILSSSDARRGAWGIEVVELPSGRPLYQRDADHLFIPASNMKMFSTAAALEKLGPDYTSRTTVESDTPPDAQGRVPSLYIVGRGDPNLGRRTFPYTYHSAEQPAEAFLEELAAQVKARGLREIEGTLVADDSYFLWEPFAPNWAADDLEWGYGAPVTALAFNDNALTLRVKPGAKVGDPAAASLEPLADYYQLKNRVETSAPGTEKRIFVERLPGSMQLDVWGQIPVGGDEDTDTVAILNPPRLVAELFRHALEAQGIVVKGEVEVRHSTRLEAASQPATFPQTPSRVVLAEHDSPPLREAIKVINKESQNLHAEMLLRTLGRVVNNIGSLTVGLETLNHFDAQQVGIVPGETYFSDGSGLSREDLVAPHAIVKLLLYMAESPRFQVFFDSLPISGTDGTLTHHLEQNLVSGRIHAKTGSEEHVNTLSGYMDLPSGKRLAFSIMANNHPLASQAGEETVDAIAVEIYRWFAKRTR
jgi:D-alanyl-D-alanine carboxypeptidase/D-alanyl-D-alanine-endopeptidase (penicillin-binding protein 4)